MGSGVGSSGRSGKGFVGGADGSDGPGSIDVRLGFD